VNVTPQGNTTVSRTGHKFSETGLFEYRAYIELFLRRNQDLLLGATKSMFFAEAGTGPGVGFLNENRSRSEIFSFYRSRIIDFIKFRLSLNG